MTTGTNPFKTVKEILDRKPERIHLINFRGDSAMCGIDTEDKLSIYTYGMLWRSQPDQIRRPPTLPLLCEKCHAEIGTFLRETREARERIKRERDEEEAAQREKERLEYEDDVRRGSPGHASCEEVQTNLSYRKVADVDGETYPASRMLVVRHIGQDTMWACRYGIRDDDSDYDQPQSWHEVEEKKITKTVYDRK